MQVVKDVDHEDAVGHAVGNRHHIRIRLHQFKPLVQLRRELGAEHLGEARERLDGDDAAVGHGARHGHGVDAGPGTVVHDCLVALEPQQRHDGRLRQGSQARRVLQPPGVLRVERVGHHAATVVTSNAGGWCRCFFTVQRLMAFTMAARYLSGKPAGSFSSRSILLDQTGVRVAVGAHGEAGALGSMPRCCMKPSA